MAKPSPKFSGHPVLTNLGLAIRQSRKTLGLSQETLALNAEIDRSYMGGIERGEHNITLINLLKICDCLDTKPSKLFEKIAL